MKELVLSRVMQPNNAMLGILHGLSKTVFTLEDRWRDNKQNISCIPSGEYICRPHGWEENSPFRFKRTWQVQGVPNRSAILIHSGNNHKNTEGCILVGLSLTVDETDSKILFSKKALELLREEIGESEFKLRITGWM